MMNPVEIAFFLLEFVWMTIKVWFHIFEAFVRMIIPHSSKDIKRKVVLITGGGGGIGRALAIEFAKKGARIVIWDINQNAAVETATLVRERGVECEAFVCDVTNKTEVNEIAKQVFDHVGTVDILVNNAGVFFCRPLLNLSEEEIRRTMGVNTLAVFWTVQAFLPRMIAQKSGHFVTISSMAGKHGSPLTVDYTASKFGAYGLMEALRAELHMQGHTGIHCSVVCPMMVNTEMLQRFEDRIVMRDRFGRIYEPDFVATEAVKRVLKNHRYIYIPADKAMVGVLNEVLPYKSRMAILEFTDAGFSEKKRNKSE